MNGDNRKTTHNLTCFSMIFCCDFCSEKMSLCSLWLLKLTPLDCATVSEYPVVLTERSLERTTVSVTSYGSSLNSAETVRLSGIESIGSYEKTEYWVGSQGRTADEQDVGPGRGSDRNKKLRLELTLACSRIIGRKLIELAFRICACLAWQPFTIHDRIRRSTTLHSLLLCHKMTILAMHSSLVHLITARS